MAEWFKALGKGIMITKKLVNCLYPNHRLYGPYIRSDAREYYVLAKQDIYGKVPKNGKKKSILKSRLMIELLNEAVLPTSKHVDHIDGNVTNDDISNLQVLDGKYHQVKDAFRIGLFRTTRTLTICPCCSIEFLVSAYRKKTAILKQRLPCCSRSCSSIVYGGNQYKKWGVGEKVS